MRIPAGAHDFEEFRRWVRSTSFPERGRIDHLAGDVEVDMSPEDLYTHGTVKTAMVAKLHSLVSGTTRGHVFADRTRVSSPRVGLSAEPDIVVVFWESLDRGQVRQIAAEGKGKGRFIELEGAPDLVVEILSDSSVHKDTERLPRFYQEAGIPEFWLVDARGEDLRFDVHELEGSRYRSIGLDPQGWHPSPLFEMRFRLLRHSAPHDSSYYELEHDE